MCNYYISITRAIVFYEMWHSFDLILPPPVFKSHQSDDLPVSTGRRLLFQLLLSSCAASTARREPSLDAHGRRGDEGAAATETAADALGSPLGGAGRRHRRSCIGTTGPFHVITTTSFRHRAQQTHYLKKEMEGEKFCNFAKRLPARIIN